MNRRLTLLIVSLFINNPVVRAEDKPSESIEINYVQRRFSPEMINVSAGVPLTVKVVNGSKERIEFESFKLNREKVVEPGQTLVVRLPALRPGSYDFFDDFHADVPEGAIVAR